MSSIYDVEIKCGSCDSIVEAERPRYGRTIGLMLAVVIGIFLLFVGLTIGVATAGYGLTAAPFTTIIGGYLGYRGGKWGAKLWDGVTCPDCGHRF